MTKGMGRNQGTREVGDLAAMHRRLAAVELQQAQMAAGVQYLVTQAGDAGNSTRVWAQRWLAAQLAAAILAIGVAVVALICLALGLLG